MVIVGKPLFNETIPVNFASFCVMVQSALRNSMSFVIKLQLTADRWSVSSHRKSNLERFHFIKVIIATVVFTVTGMY